jgi:hypothetical protein
VAGGKNDILLYIHKADNVNYEDASYVCYIRAEQESVSALFLQFRAGETNRRNKAPIVGCTKGPKVHAEVSVPVVVARAVQV